MTLFRSITAVALVAAAMGAGCGRKGDVRPPEDVLPQPITQLRANDGEAGIRLEWERPLLYIDGERLRDLGGFEIWRGSDASGDDFERIAKIAVDDRERFQQAKGFHYVDNEVRSGQVYRYYVVSFTVDEYFSNPSNVVTITRETKGED